MNIKNNNNNSNKKDILNLNSSIHSISNKDKCNSNNNLSRWKALLKIRQCNNNMIIWKATFFLLRNIQLWMLPNLNSLQEKLALFKKLQSQNCHQQFRVKIKWNILNLHHKYIVIMIQAHIKWMFHILDKLIKNPIHNLKN